MKQLNRAVAILFCAFLLALGLLTVLSEDQDFSEDENRPLQTFPAISWKRIASGTFTKEMETYVSDQFAAKRFWTGVKAASEKLLLKKDNNGVFFGKDGYLLEPFPQPGGQLAANSENIAAFTDGLPADMNVYGLLAPTSVGIYPEKLPLFAQTADEFQAIRRAEQLAGDRIAWIDAAGPLREAKEGPIYYRTDHHWTTLGAYTAYRAAAGTMELTPEDPEAFNVKTVTRDFKGTYDAKANDPSVVAEPIEVYLPKKDRAYSVEFDDSGMAADSLYDWSFLDKRDKYSLFLGGNHRAVTIRSSVHNGRKLLVVKDSYAHSLVPFLANHFEEIYMVDLRYDHRSMRQVLEKKNIREVLFLYNIANFAEVENLIWLRQ